MFACTIATGLFVRERVRRMSEEEARAALTRMAEAFDVQTAPLRAAGDRAALGDLVKRLGAAQDVRVTLVDRDGTVLAETDSDPAVMVNHGDRAEIVAARPGAPGWAIRRSGTTGAEFLYVAVRAADGVAVRTASPLPRLEEHLVRLNEELALGLGVALLFALALGLAISGRLTRRLEEQIAAAERVAAGDLAARVEVRGDDELDAMGRALNRVAERLAAQIDELTARRKEIADVFDSTADGLVAINADDVVTHVNPAAARLFDAPADAAGRPFWETVRDASLPDLVARVRADLKPRETDLTLERPPPRRELEARVSPIHAPDGGYAGAVVAFRDVTRLKKLEQMRRDFVANVSHEMKTPLTSILGSIETLQNGASEDSEASKEFLAKIDRNARSLAHLVTDLLELSRIEAGGVQFSPEPIAVADVVAEAVAAATDKAREKGLTLDVDAPPESLRVRGDPELLIRALVNLLDNAVAYTPSGGSVSVSARAAGDRCEIVVADTGIGIPASDLERVFERFYRVDKARSRSLGGTGLGLAIVRHVAERHGGVVRVRSEEGRGSTFTLSLPRFDAGPRAVPSS